MAIVAALLVAAPATAQSASEAAWEATPGEGLSPDEIAWHVRAGLNVAALSCRDRDAATMVAGYNRLLSQHRAPLAAARSGIEATLRVRFGEAWQEHDDGDMTRLYNHFASPDAHDALCAAAGTLLRDSETIAPAEFYAFARYALPQLERAIVPERSLVAQARYLLAASDDAPRVAYATNARIPLAPEARDPVDPPRGDEAPPSEATTASAPVLASTDAPVPGFSSIWP